MLPPSYLDAMPDAFVQLAQQVEDEILQDVARRIGKMGTLTETADWQLWRYQQTEAVRENVVKSARNIPGVLTTPANNLNVYDIINAQYLVADQAALAKIEEVYA